MANFVNCSIKATIEQQIPDADGTYFYTHDQHFSFDKVEDAIAFCSKACAAASNETKATINMVFSTVDDDNEDDLIIKED